MKLKDTNSQIMSDYVKAATLMKAKIFCAFAEGENGQINILLSKTENALETVRRLREIANNIELRAKEN